ncbi:hypothetical protein [Ferrovibrio xuzhouensis]|uniref:Glycosyl transferase n=1 Tax=Ferrovibrio xuzhouensis TaxID=1576914 RepID=A0ABV7VQH7_9PROT
MSPRYFCTLFDRNYLFKGVAMLQTLRQNCPDAHVHVLCMDAQTRSILEQLKLPDVVCLSLDEIEDEALLKAKADRGIAEYCWTLSPCLPWHVLQRNPEIDFITYLDADLLFYSPIQPLFDEIGDASIAIIEHRFSERLKDREVNGRFCVEWVSFRRDEQGMACLSRWRDQCMEWCYYRLEDGKMGDQKYLDEWPGRYSGCHILMHPGAGIAPWNYEQYRFAHDAAGGITVQDSPLIFYHFHQFQLIENGRFDRLSTFYTASCREPEMVYQAYETKLGQVIREVQSIIAGFSGGFVSPTSMRKRRWIQQLIPMPLKEIARQFIRY